MGSAKGSLLSSVRQGDCVRPIKIGVKGVYCGTPGSTRMYCEHPHGHLLLQYTVYETAKGLTPLVGKETPLPVPFPFVQTMDVAVRNNAALYVGLNRLIGCLEGLNVGHSQCFSAFRCKMYHMLFRM
jgi:hypothetical protein